MGSFSKSFTGSLNLRKIISLIPLCTIPLMVGALLVGRLDIVVETLIALSALAVVLGILIFKRSLSSPASVTPKITSTEYPQRYLRLIKSGELTQI